MSDENETTTGPQPDPAADTPATAAPTRVHEHHVSGISHEIRETGDGSLLAQTVNLVEARSKSAAYAVPIINGIENADVILKPDGDVDTLGPQFFDDYRSKPLYRTGTAKLGSVASLIDYTNRYKGSGTVLFANDDRSAPSLTSVFDYHEQGGPEDGGQRFGRHRAVHNLTLSDEWKAWQSLNGKAITMPNFARFLEDHIVDVLGVGEISLSPAQQQFVDALGGVSNIADPARLMELATGLRVYENAQVSQAVNLASGEGEVIFTSEHVNAQGGKLNIPRLFVLAIPVFQNGDPYQIVTRLRYRKEGGITFIYELWRDDLVFDHAFAEAADFAAKGTDVPLFLGNPE